MNSTADLALGVVALVVVLEHAFLLAMWGLFWKRGWKVSVAPKAAPQNAAAPAVEAPSAGAAVPAGANGAAA